MLILTRKKDESIIINGEIEFKIISVEGDKVRIGIEAPTNVEIFRKELYDKIVEENKTAQNTKKFLEEVKELMKK